MGDPLAKHKETARHWLATMNLSDRDRKSLERFCGLGRGDYLAHEEAVVRSLDGVWEHAIEWLGEQGLLEDGDEEAVAALQVAALWKEAPQDTPEGTEAFYSRPDVSRHMVRKLAGWHAEDPNVFRQNASIVGHSVGPRVLDFGAGIGTLAIGLALHGFEVEAIELGPHQRGFALARAERFGVEIKFVDKPTGLYDTICAMDVAEHLHRPADLPEWVHAHLEPDGVFCANWVFHRDDYNPQHVKECTPPAVEFHKRMRQLFYPADPMAAVTSNGWPSIHQKRAR